MSKLKMIHSLNNIIKKEALHTFLNVTLGKKIDNYFERNILTEALTASVLTKPLPYKTH